MSDARTLAKGIDAEACLDTLSEMVRHKSYSETEGEKALASTPTPQPRAGQSTPGAGWSMRSSSTASACRT